MIGLLLSALNPFKMILFWGLKKIPLLLEIPTLKDHLTKTRRGSFVVMSKRTGFRRSLAHWFVALRLSLKTDFSKRCFDAVKGPEQ